MTARSTKQTTGLNLKLRQIASVICFLAGIGMIFLSFRLEEQEGFLYLHSYYCGGGGGIIGASAVNFFRAHSQPTQVSKSESVTKIE